MTISLLVEIYNEEVTVTPFKDRQKALIEFSKKVALDKKEYPNTIVTDTEDFYENYEVGSKSDSSSTIYVVDKEVQ